ncbi:unnamed protein product, partial [Amoebophrya sp. A120]
SADEAGKGAQQNGISFDFHAMRRCDGLRDLGNLQDFELKECLLKCESNPVCKSVTWSATNKRCFLSSVCENAIAVTDFRYLLFERRENAVATDALIAGHGSSPLQKSKRLLSSNNLIAEWTPRIGHGMAVFKDEVVVLGGHGVNELGVKGVLKEQEKTEGAAGEVDVDVKKEKAKTSGAKEKSPAKEAKETTTTTRSTTAVTGGETKEKDNSPAALEINEDASSNATAANASTTNSTNATETDTLAANVQTMSTNTTSTNATTDPLGSKMKKDNITVTRQHLAADLEHGLTRKNLVYSYRSRNVDLSEKYIPIRDLPYGRLSDVWVLSSSAVQQPDAEVESLAWNEFASSSKTNVTHVPASRNETDETVAVPQFSETTRKFLKLLRADVNGFLRARNDTLLPLTEEEKQEELLKQANATASNSSANSTETAPAANSTMKNASAMSNDTATSSGEQNITGSLDNSTANNDANTTNLTLSTNLSAQEEQKNLMTPQKSATVVDEEAEFLGSPPENNQPSLEKAPNYVKIVHRRSNATGRVVLHAVGQSPESEPGFNTSAVEVANTTNETATVPPNTSAVASDAESKTGVVQAGHQGKDGKDTKAESKKD